MSECQNILVFVSVGHSWRLLLVGVVGESLVDTIEVHVIPLKPGYARNTKSA